MASGLCPRCGSSVVRRSRRKTLLEKLILPLFRHRPFRCRACDHRFYARADRSQRGSAAPTNPELAA